MGLRETHQADANTYSRRNSTGCSYFLRTLPASKALQMGSLFRPLGTVWDSVNQQMMRYSSKIDRLINRRAEDTHVRSEYTLAIVCFELTCLSGKTPRIFARAVTSKLNSAVPNVADLCLAGAAHTDTGWRARISTCSQRHTNSLCVCLSLPPSLACSLSLSFAHTCTHIRARSFSLALFHTHVHTGTYIHA